MKILNGIIKIIKFILIFCISLWVYANVLDYIFWSFWNFDIFSHSSWQKVSNFWNAGGTFKSFKEVSLLFALIFAIPTWILLCILLYKIKYIKILICLFQSVSLPQKNEEQRIVIKNIGNHTLSQEEVLLNSVKNKNIETHSAKKIRDAFLQKINKPK